MKRVWLAALSLGCANLFGQGLQTVSYTTKQQAPPPPALRATANLVVVDVVVRDKAGRPIKGLKQEDFVLTEDKSAQRINHFEEHTSAEIVPAAQPKLPDGVFTNFAPTSAKGPLNILLLDKLDTMPKDQSKLRTELLKYLDTARPGTRIAIFELGDRLRLLQGFTDNREMLRAALTKYEPGRPELSDSMNQSSLSGWSPRGDWCAPPPRGGPDLCPEVLWHRSRLRSVTIAQAMHVIAWYVSAMPGRKNLLWYSGNFPLYFLSSPTDCHTSNCPPIDTALIKDFRKAADQLAANLVSVYPIDARGLAVTSFNEIGDPMGMTVDFDRRTNRQEFGAMTGGRAFVDTNFMDQVTAEAIEDGSNYYTLTYAPANGDWNGDYRDIAVKLADGRAADLSFRRGYYATDPNKPVKTAIFGRTELPQKDRPVGTMEMTSMLGVPEPSQVVFVARVTSANGGTERTLAEGNEGSKGLIGPYQRYVVKLAVDSHTLNLTESADSSRHGSLEYVTFVYDRNGSVINSLGRTANLNLKANAYEGILRGGLPLEAEISVPAKGDYTFRIVVRDLSDDHVGAIEVPTATVKNLAAK